MVVSLLTHICVTRPQWVDTSNQDKIGRYCAVGILKCICEWKFDILFGVSELKLIPNGPIDNKLSVVQISRYPNQGWPSSYMPYYWQQWRHNGRDGVSNHQPSDCLLNRLFRRRPKKTSKLRVTGPCEGNSPVTGEFAAQMASNTENVSIWWHHHAFIIRTFTQTY